MIVEFTGISGSGKTTLAKLANERLNARGVDVVSRSRLIENYVRENNGRGAICVPTPNHTERRLLRRAYRSHYSLVLSERFAALHPEAWVALQHRLETIENTRPHALARMIELWVGSIAADYVLLRDAVPSRTLFLWQEGIAHRAVNLFADISAEVDLAELERFLSIWPFPDVLVMVASERDHCYRRIVSRGLTKRLQGSSPRDVLAFLGNSSIVVESIVREAYRRNINVLHVANKFDSVQALEESQTWGRALDVLQSNAGNTCS